MRTFKPLENIGMMTAIWVAEPSLEEKTKITFIEENKGVVSCTVLHHQSHLSKESCKIKLWSVNPSVKIFDHYLVSIIGEPVAPNLRNLHCKHNHFHWHSCEQRKLSHRIQKLPYKIYKHCPGHTVLAASLPGGRKTTLLVTPAPWIGTWNTNHVVPRKGSKKSESEKVS